ncbi:hypothetical protein HMPREF0682_1800 [Propionibacterium acidifaciens F0233]|uniref:Uncharacterized protein n=1 Tax=Propionibacterium acidifaciens F0233 TaxID=553198 RepID=U2S8K7_9ACTN|nr:hypothetical protein HMPREF0682_1800 [Propionibacterium acidifaciens F0233]
MTAIPQLMIIAAEEVHVGDDAQTGFQVLVCDFSRLGERTILLHDADRVSQLGLVGRVCPQNTDQFRSTVAVSSSQCEQYLRRHLARGDVLGGSLAPFFAHGSHVELVIDHLESQPDLLTESRVSRECPVVGIGYTRADLEWHSTGVGSRAMQHRLQILEWIVIHGFLGRPHRIDSGAKTNHPVLPGKLASQPPP